MPKACKRRIAVFLASPGDLSAERKWFKEAVDLLNVGFGDVANVEFKSLGWEDTLAATGRRPQGLLNADVDRCDVFILMLNRRWGQEAPDADPYSSYTEEEFYRALDRFEKTGTPEIFVFFKRVDATSEADPDPQLEKVLAFRRQLEESRQVLYRYFDNSKPSFINEIDSHLRAYVNGELVSPAKANEKIILPLSIIAEVTKAREEASANALMAEEANNKAEAAYLKLEKLQLQSAEEAAYLAKEGQLELARNKFVEVLADTSNLKILFLAYEYFYRTGDFITASDILKKWLNISGHDRETLETAAAYGNLGNIYSIWGNIELAEEMHKKALDINIALNNNEGMAAAYGNIGNLYRTRGNLEQAEASHKKALEINVLLNNKEGLADDYGNIGIIYGLQKKYDCAETYFKKSLSLNSSVNRRESLANDYRNLGNIFLLRDDFSAAEEMYKKSLAIDKALGQKVGMSDNYGNIGNIYIKRSMLGDAEDMFNKALSIDEDLGRLEGMANNYTSLGLIYKTQAYIESADEMFKKALKIYRVLRSPRVQDVEEWRAQLQDSALKRNK